MKKMHQISLIAAFVFILLAGPAAAAEISLNVKNGERMETGEKIILEVSLNADEDDINAVGGTINFPDDILTLCDVQDANSVVSLWIDDPKDPYPGRVAFSGIIPGGFRGNGGLLLKLIFFAQKEGQGTVMVNNAQALLNDGKGTSAPLEVASYAFTVVSNKSGRTPDVAAIIDTDPPESFKPETGRDPAIGEGRWFAVFSTQDKGSGIDRYEIKESSPQGLGLSGDWVAVKSPYILIDQTLRSTVMVKAIDRAGNERVEEIAPAHPLPWYENYGAWAIIGVCLVVLLVLFKTTWRILKRK